MDQVIKEAITELQNTRSMMKTLKASEEKLQAFIADKFSEEIGIQLGKKEYGAGTANILVDGTIPVKFDVGKTVKWDQEGLAGLFNKIAETGNPKEYIQVKYDVSENAYKAWPSDIKAFFEPMRTVTTTKVKVTIVEKGE